MYNNFDDFPRNEIEFIGRAMTRQQREWRRAEQAGIKLDSDLTYIPVEEFLAPELVAALEESEGSGEVFEWEDDDYWEDDEDD